jgi:hypothetical protein
MIYQNQKKKNLIPTAIYLVIWGGMIQARKMGLMSLPAFYFAILNVVFGCWGMQFKGLKFYVEYLLLFAIYVSYIAIGSAAYVLYNGSLPLTRLEFWLVTFLISAILFLFHISSVNFKSPNGMVFIKKCIVNRYVLLLTFVIQVYLLAN